MPLETLAAFRRRTDAFIWDSLPPDVLQTHGRLGDKVGAEGKLQPFWGSTVVFCLPQPAKAWLARVQAALYAQAGDLLAEPLDPDGFHITLHDLVSGCDRAGVEQDMARLRGPARQCVRELVSRGEVIRLRPTAVFSMVSTSVVLGFEPSEETSCRRLMEYYEQMQQVHALDYPLTPHVTLAYYRPGCIEGDRLARLRRAIREANGQWKPELELYTMALAYQEFADMNTYRAVD